MARTFVRGDVPILGVHFDDTVVTTTAEHPFWVTDAGWTEAGELKPGMELVTADGATVAVDSVEFLDRTATVYNIEVAGHHTYFVSDEEVLVHNLCGPRPAWPKTAEGMDDFLGMSGSRVPDTARTPGRNQVIWKTSDNVTITMERHPYHADSPAFHSDYHYHVDTPGHPHVRYLPGDPIPGY